MYCRRKRNIAFLHKLDFYSCFLHRGLIQTSCSQAHSEQLFRVSIKLPLKEKGDGACGIERSQGGVGGMVKEGGDEGIQGQEFITWGTRSVDRGGGLNCTKSLFLLYYQPCASLPKSCRNFSHHPGWDNVIKDT